MDESTLDVIARMICGNGRQDPVYRSGSNLTGFFQRAGLPRFVHDGSTRQVWVLDCLKSCSREELAQVLKRLASPREYRGDREQLAVALKLLNDAVYIEGFQIRLKGSEPRFEKIEVDYSDVDSERGLKPQPPPEFGSLGLESQFAALLEARWDEAQRCVDAKAHLAGMIVMGSLLEGLLLGVMQRLPKEANTAAQSPRDASGKVKSFMDWSLSQMIDVAHGNRWIDLDVKHFSHALREFRNLVHPYTQMMSGAGPDGDTCEISWLVVQAAVNDLARQLK